MSKKSVSIYITQEVRELINLLNPNAVIEPDGLGKNSLVSLPDRKQPRRTLGYDCYEMAEKWNCTPDEAKKRMTDEGWVFQEYDAIFGTERYTEPFLAEE